jgi:hypothetical protein
MDFSMDPRTNATLCESSRRWNNLGVPCGLSVSFRKRREITGDVVFDTTRCEENANALYGPWREELDELSVSFSMRK